MTSSFVVQPLGCHKETSEGQAKACTTSPNPSTIPEAAETIAAQIRWLLAGKRKAVLIPPGTATPVIAFPDRTRLETCLTTLGVFYYDSTKTSACEIHDHVYTCTIGELLGYGVPRKPEEATDVIVIRGPNGREKQSVVVGDNSEPETRNAERAAHAMADPGDTITREAATAILKERCDELAKHEMTLHAFQPEDMLALQDLAHAEPEGRLPHHPTWVIRRHGKVVGAVGINSLPLYHLWLPIADVSSRQCHDVLKHIENTYRLAGHPVLGTLVDVDCASYPLAARHGYVELPDERLFLKQL